MFRKYRNGQSMVEFALILPILILLVLGIVEFGLMFNSYLTVQNVSREGARLAIVGGTDTEIRAHMVSISPNLTPVNLSVTITPIQGSRTSGASVTVQANYTYPLTVPIIKNLLKNTISLKAQTTMRME